MIQRKKIFTICALIAVRVLVCTQSNTIDSKASAELPVPTLKSNTTVATK
jgi:hypothetical protein